MRQAPFVTAVIFLQPATQAFKYVLLSEPQTKSGVKSHLQFAGIVMLDVDMTLVVVVFELLNKDWFVVTVLEFMGKTNGVLVDIMLVVFCDPLVGTLV